MKRVSKLVIYGLVIVGMAIAIITTNIYPLSNWATAIAQVTQTETTTAKRLNITVNVTEPDDLKVSEGEQIAKGDIIADRERERTRLTAQQKQLQLSLDRLRAASITPPAAPQAVPTVPTVMALPPVSYLEHEAAVEKTKSAIANLEIRTADLLAAKAELERQQSEEKLEIEDKVLNLLLDYEAKERKHELLLSQLETLEQQREVTRIAYRMGRGSTSQLLGMENRRDRMTEQIVEVEIDKDEAVRKIEQLIGL